MASVTARAASDWLSSWRTNLVAWWIPQVAVLAGLLVPVPIRAMLWIVALVWMGTACILNARRCGRTHCRYTGPFYLAMVVPVLVLASDIVSVDFYIGCSHSCRQQDHLVGHRAGMGEILIEPNDTRSPFSGPAVLARICGLSATKFCWQIAPCGLTLRPERFTQLIRKRRDHGP